MMVVGARHVRSGMLCCALVLLAGCASLEPYRKPYAWHPVGANQANLAAMVADPHDLVRGQSEQETDAQAPVLAIERVREDKPKRLPSTSGIFGGAIGSGSGLAAGANNGGSPVSAYGY
ncbi:hypothetical protein AA0522_0171 [Gluconacetobacter liquefaciens NRIC 0522]|uniref:Beta-barrel assembly complex subunit BamF n=2 Tax=Gluconacetobacter liquefaciens TaxID=89584 RepID=A0A7W4JK54_GLULI|nr:CpaD family pilus assembly lipoprotein [Gluconacetobacter liquefaciens]MBB2186227.1 hypothetical protein [Gluconacetobacter liquefaciens]GBQ93114.1 hypothetical protein AA0522_0171 [Gluconacetobacter liquefaciens NRIC 0522]